MRAEVKRWWSDGLRDAPEDPEHCCVGMQADIGPVGADGGDTFNFEVCTPNAQPVLRTSGCCGGTAANPETRTRVGGMA
jgi:hypothetical protein